MPLYDLICSRCQIIKSDVMLKMNESPSVKCPSCSDTMKKRVNGLNFKLEYNNKTDICDWQGNTSQYWSDYKKQKSEGKNVKPIGED